MNKLAIFLALATSGLAIGSTQAAVTLTFDPLTNTADNFAIGTSYSESGFTLTVTGTSANFGAWGSSNPTPPYTGSASLFAVNQGNVITLAKNDGSAFALSSIDISELNGGAGMVPVEFTAFSGGVQFGPKQLFQTDGVFGNETVAFLPNFSNVTSVSWDQVLNFHQFDNVVLNDVSAVPEPSSLLLVGLMAASCIGYRRRPC